MNPPAPSERARIPVRLASLSLLAVLAFRFSGPLSLDANDQAKQALYVLDIRQNGNWILPQERGSIPATKPPLYAWLGVVSSAMLGGDLELACRVPSALAFLVVGWLVFRVGAERWGPHVGALAVAAFATSHVAIDLAVQIRPDMVMTALVGAAFLALHRAELGELRGGSALFWTMSSLSVLTKGPFAPAIVAAGVAASWLTPSLRPALRAVVCSRWAALSLIPLAWLGLAVLVGETSWVRETVLPETLDRVLATGTRAGRSVVPGYLVAQLVGKTLPWSIFAGIGIASALRRVPESSAARPGRLLASLLLGGMGILSLSRGLRQDYVLPFIPLVALLSASALLEDAPVLCATLWRRGAWMVGAALALVVSAVATGVVDAPQITPLWAGCAIAGLVLLLGSAVASWRTVRFGSRQAIPGIVALLLLHAVYNAALSPVARSPREPLLRAFAADVNKRTQERDRIELVRGVPGSVFFLLRRNRPELNIDDLGDFAPWRPVGGRLLLVVRESEARELDRRWPDRFRRLAGTWLLLVEDTHAT
jgi:4-amino-4-deoxy-L-arabinose transferase-like glycosyltransferase